MSFKDHFSEHATEYARHRPRYPKALFEYLSALPAKHDLAWDVGTGNGQAAIALAQHFKRVVATDASAQQIEQAPPHPAVTYAVAPAEQVPLQKDSVDLILAAQSAHWFDLPRFYKEAQRVARPGAVIALISYALPRIDPAIDSYVSGFANHILASYWPRERVHVDSRYLTLPFPFDEIQPPTFEIMARWQAQDLLNYLGTWSGTRIYMRSHNTDPRVLIGQGVRDVWGDGEREVTWPLGMRVGRVS